jgi:hypothetical protein
MNTKVELQGGVVVKVNKHIFLLEGPNKGKTMMVGNYKFVNGKLTIYLAANQVASTESFVKRWGARLLSPAEVEALEKKADATPAPSPPPVPPVDRNVPKGGRSAAGSTARRGRNAGAEAADAGVRAAGDDGQGASAGSVQQGPAEEVLGDDADLV